MDWFTPNQHKFTPKRFNKPTYCEYCNNLIWGVIGKQGQKCTNCKTASHHECASLFDHTCGVAWMSDDNELHQFEDKRFNKFTFCNVCRGFIKGVTGKQGQKCNVCGMCKHSGCDAGRSCPRVDVGGEEEIQHFWVEGNLQGKCKLCRKECNLDTHIGGVRCFWCRLKLCSQKCKAKLESPICDLGSFSKLIISPSGIITHGSQDIREWTFMPSALEGKKPLFVFINKRSGGGLGGSFMNAFCKFLNPLQVIDLGNGGPDNALAALNELGLDNFTLIACGGDGTVAWILSALDKLELDHNPPVAVLPLGTGNDLSRALGWGPGADKSSEVGRKLLPHILMSREVPLDRWRLQIDDEKTIIVNNYFSVGIDAKIALDFHTRREANPEKFTSRGRNKVWYAKLGADAIFAGLTNLRKRITVELDGKVLDLPKIEALVVTNLPSCYGGAYLWSTSSKEEPISITDGLFEVVGMKDAAHVGQVQSGLASPVIIGKGSHLRITYDEPVYAQADGEPWLQEAGVMELSYFNTVNMLCYAKNAHETLKIDMGDRTFPDEESLTEDELSNDSS